MTDTAVSTDTVRRGTFRQRTAPSARRHSLVVPFWATCSNYLLKTSLISSCLRSGPLLAHNSHFAGKAVLHSLSRKREHVGHGCDVLKPPG